MLPIVLMILLPSLVVANVKEAQTAAWCAIHCLPPIPYPKTADANCLRLVYNATTTQGNGLWAYDRLVFEGPECGTYNFVIKTKSKLAMFTGAYPNTTEVQEGTMPANTITCLRACGGGLLEPSCTAPTYSVSMGWVEYGSRQTVYRTFQFGCEVKTTIIRSYRPEFEILAELEPYNRNTGKVYNELWSIKGGFLQTVPHHTNIISKSIGVVPGEGEVGTDKTVCALKCFNYTNPPSTGSKTCKHTLKNETVNDINGKWSYDRAVFEGPECDGRYTFLITTKSNVSMSIDDGVFITAEHDVIATSTTNLPAADCMRSCGFDVCSPPSLGYSQGNITSEDGTKSTAYQRAQYDCNGVKHLILRSFREEAFVRIDLEREEEPKLYSEKWRVKDGQLVKEEVPYSSK